VREQEDEYLLLQGDTTPHKSACKNGNPGVEGAFSRDEKLEFRGQVGYT
jgi:hypothetical protein